MQGIKRGEVTSAALLSFLQAEQDAAEWELVALERHDPGKHNQKTHGDWAHPGGVPSSGSSPSSKSSSSSSSPSSASSPAQHMSATLASKAAFYQGLASHPLSKTWTAQDQQLAAQMAKDFQAISDGLKSGKDVTSLVADMTKAAQSLHDAAPTHMTQARLDVMNGMQKRITHALGQHASSSSSSSSSSGSSHSAASSSGHSGSSGSGSSSSSHHGSSSSGHHSSSSGSSSHHSSGSSSGSSGHSSSSGHGSSSGHSSGHSSGSSSHHSGSSGSAGSSGQSSGASSSHGSSHSAHGSSSGHSSSGGSGHSSGSSSHHSGSSHGGSSSKSAGSGSSGSGSGKSGSGGSSSGSGSTASPQAQHMSSILADKASFYSDLASKAVGKNWTAQDQQIASQMAQDMQSISDGLKSGKDVSAQIADMVKSAQALHGASPSHMTETKLDVMAGLQKRIGNALSRALSADEALERRDYSQSERDNMDDSDFAGPHESYPIKTQQDVYNAARLVGHADNPDAVKAKIKSIAKRKGFKLPDSWQNEEDSSKERAMGKGNHAPFTGTHTHAHPAFGAQGNDETHTHEHTHDNDADHGHEHADDPQERSVGAMTPQDFSLYLPITRTDATQRRVFGQATIEQPDAYGTIFGFYPEAWQKWRGNIREQHDPKKAVGKALEVLSDEQRRAIDVDLKVSRGAQDTWLKVEDGVLTGLSASIIPDEEFGNDIRKWPKKEYNGKQYPYLPRYSVVELSLVDNPATPGCNIQIVRSLDGASLATDVLDFTEEAAITPETPTADAKERAGASISAANRTKLHAMRDSAMQMCADNGCDECKGMMAGGDDGDGDNDNDTAERMLAVLERSLAPVYSRQQQFLARLAQTNSDYSHIHEQLSTLTATVERLASNPTNFERVLADLSAVKVEVEKIAAQPMPGGPILNGARPAEKTLATDPYRAPRDNAQEVLARMQQLGALDTIDKQVAAAALAAQPVRGPYSR